MTIAETIAEVYAIEGRSLALKMEYTSKMNPSEVLTNDYFEKQYDFASEKEELLDKLLLKIEFEKAINSMSKKNANLHKI